MGPSTSPATCPPDHPQGPCSPNHRALKTFTRSLSSRPGRKQEVAALSTGQGTGVVKVWLSLQGEGLLKNEEAPEATQEAAWRALCGLSGRKEPEGYSESDYTGAWRLGHSSVSASFVSLLHLLRVCAGPLVASSSLSARILTRRCCVV